MTVEQARSLIRSEALGEASLLGAARMGEPLEPRRLATLIEAIRLLFGSLQGAASLDRDLAFELHLLGAEPRRQLESWRRAGGLSESEMRQVLGLEAAVESVFAGEWFDTR